MEFSEIRMRINELDRELIRCFDDRLLCSVDVAEAKLATDDPVYKPLREKEIYARYDDDLMGREHKSYMKHIIMQSRRHQYRQFIEQGRIDEDFYEWIGGRDAFTEGTELSVCVNADNTGENGLATKDILQIIADSSCDIKDVSFEGEKIHFSMVVPRDSDLKKEAIVFIYMLYKETKK